MSEKITFIVLLFFICFFPFASFGTDGSGRSEEAGMFPEIDGWTMDGTPEIYFADNLWEYINGAADVYLRYDFQKVATLTYDKGQNQSLTVDIYQHGDGNNAFGIYSQERPLEGSFLTVGTQGYYGKGIFNFFLGRYYVKMMGFYLEEEEEKSFLTSVARDIAGRLEGEPGFPKILDCFPDEAKVENSEEYIAKDFLGRSYLHSAFTSDYQFEEEEAKIFIIEAADEDEAEDMVGKYLKMVNEKGSSITNEKGFYTFEDPYFRSSGPMNLKSKGKYIWGLFSKSPSVSKFYIDKVEENLKNNHLIG